MKPALPILLVVRTADGRVPAHLADDLEATDIEVHAMFRPIEPSRQYRAALISVGSTSLDYELRERMRAWVDSVVVAHIPRSRRPVWL